MTLPMTASRSARELVSDADVRQQALDGAALALEHLDDLEGQPVHVRRGQRLEQRLEPVEQHGQVQGGRGLRQRDDVAPSSRVSPPEPSPSVSAM